MITKTMSRNYNYEVENDRKEAIVKAFDCLNDHEILLIAGKGHEQVQIVRDNHFPFSDFEQASVAIELMD